MIFEYKGKWYPEYLKTGNACRFVTPAALEFCKGSGLDVGASRWPLPGAIPVDLQYNGDAMNLPDGPFDYVFSSHCLEHIPDVVGALLHWKTRLKSGGVLFLYLPHPDMEYWLPQNCRKHVHMFWPEDMAKLLSDLGFERVIHSERDIAWGFCCVAFNG